MRVLVLVDLQNDFLHPKGSLKCPAPNTPVEWEERKLKIKEFLQKQVREPEYDLYIVTRDWHPENSLFFIDNVENQIEGVTYWPKHCIQNTWGAEFYYTEIYELLLKYPDKAVIVNKGTDGLKEDYSAVPVGPIFSQLPILPIKQVDIIGVATEYCVFSTYKDLVKLLGSEKVNLIKSLSIPYMTEEIEL